MAARRVLWTGLAGLVVLDSAAVVMAFHVLLPGPGSGPDLLMLIGAVLVLLTAVFAKIRPMWIVMLAFGCGGLAFIWVGSLLASGLGTSEIDRLARSSDGYELHGAKVIDIDTYGHAYLTRRTGPFTQEVRVWESHGEGLPPKAARFTGPDTFEIVTDEGSVKAYVFDRLTLRTRSAGAH